MTVYSINYKVISVQTALQQHTSFGCSVSDEAHFLHAEALNTRNPQEEAGNISFHLNVIYACEPSFYARPTIILEVYAMNNKIVHLVLLPTDLTFAKFLGIV